MGENRYVKKCAWALLIFVLLAGCQPSDRRRADRFVKTPYLQNPSRTEMTIRWTTGSRRECQVKYGIERLSNELKVGIYRTEDSDPPEYLYRARLTGLKPGTMYRYVVISAGYRSAGTFRTFPDKPTPFSFIAYGDSRTQVEIHQAVVSRFPKHEPAFILHTGDLVGSGAFAEWQGQFFEPTANIIREIPLWPARGNHEGDAVALRRLFTFPDDKLYYSFDYANAHFVCLDSEMPRADEMIAWCEKDLAASKATWKFVFYHVPTYDVGRHRSQWGRNDLLPIFRKHRVDFVLTGHSHSYQRFHPMFTKDENETHPITHIVTAGGGAPMYRVEDDPHLAVGRAEYHYTVFRIDGDKLSCRVLTPDGEEIDAFQVTKTDGRPDAAYLAQALPESTFGELAAVIAPFLRGLSLPEALTPEKAVSTTFKLGAGDFGMSYRILLEERAAEHYEMKPVAGTVAAGQVADVTVSIRPKEQVEITVAGVWPVLRLGCEYQIGGQRGKIYSSRLRCPPARKAP